MCMSQFLFIRMRQGKRWRGTDSESLFCGLSGRVKHRWRLSLYALCESGYCSCGHIGFVEYGRWAIFQIYVRVCVLVGEHICVCVQMSAWVQISFWYITIWSLSFLPLITRSSLGLWEKPDGLVGDDERKEKTKESIHTSSQSSIYFLFKEA